MIKSIRQVLAGATEELLAAGIAEARMEAVSLLAHALQVDRTFVITNLEEGLTAEQLRTFGELVTRRARREPLQYIVGHQEFFELDFEVTPDVLIPRPETEIVVEAALEVLTDSSAPVIADIGAGSGCIVISLLHRLRDARGVAVDISPRALSVAQRNAVRHKVADRLTLVESDLFSALKPQAQFSLIVSNPPYVSEPEIETLQPEVRDHEPMSALISGFDGLSHIRVLLREASSYVRPNGFLIFEIGFDQRNTVEQLIDVVTWRLIEVREDLQNIPRTIVLQKR
jgi:release factor glutamine methyltransferase